MTRRVAVVAAGGVLLAALGLVAGTQQTAPRPVTLVAGCALAAVTLTATSSGGDVFLSWTRDPCARAYGIHREDVPSGPYASVTATEFTDRTLRVGAEVVYFVTGYYPEPLVREGPLSNRVTVVVQ